MMTVVTLFLSLAVVSLCSSRTMCSVPAYTLKPSLYPTSVAQMVALIFLVLDRDIS
jgi:hypothetical protein